MLHLDDALCADLARNVAVSDAARLHVANCGACATRVDCLAALARMAAADAAFEPPEYAIRAARAVYALQQPRSVRLLASLAVRLVYDSFREPLVAGVRSGQAVTRHVLYEAGDDFALDLRMEHEHHSPRVVLSGQLLSGTGQRTNLVRVRLVASGARERTLAELQTNEFGEFQMEYRPAPRLRLHFDMPSENQIELPLRHLTNLTSRS